MSIRSQVLSPQDWADKAPTYIQEAREFGIRIASPDINKSSAGFTISDNNTIYFGLGSIRKVGATAARILVSAKHNSKFTDIIDFFSKIDRSRINTAVFASLVNAGCFDSLGYKRSDLLGASEVIYEWFKWKKECEDRQIENAMREIENVEIQKLIDYRDELRKKAKKKNTVLEPSEQEFLDNHKRLALKRELAMPEEPPIPSLPRYNKLTISPEELLVQGELIGCYIIHPVRMIYPNTTPINRLHIVNTYDIAGIVGEIKTYKNQRGSTTYINISDGTGTLKLPIYENYNIKIPNKGKLIQVKLKCGYDPEKNATKVYRVFKIESHQGDTE